MISLRRLQGSGGLLQHSLLTPGGRSLLYDHPDHAQQWGSIQDNTPEVQLGELTGSSAKECRLVFFAAALIFSFNLFRTQSSILP